MLHWGPERKQVFIFNSEICFYFVSFHKAFEAAGYVLVGSWL